MGWGIPEVNLGIGSAIVTVLFISESPVQVPYRTEDEFTVWRSKVFLIKEKALRMHDFIIPDQFVHHKISCELVYINKMRNLSLVLQCKAELVESCLNVVQHCGFFAFSEMVVFYVDR